ncbi:hypothetical protein Tco_0223781 [Tanacetum coccineum]
MNFAKGKATRTGVSKNTRNVTSNQLRIIRCYNYKGEDDTYAFDSDCDEMPTVSTIFMANLFAYDSDVLYEVPNHDTYQDNNVIAKSVQEMQYSKQPVFVNDSNIDITSDNYIISYDQYMKENKSKVVKDTTSSEQQDA